MNLFNLNNEQILRILTGQENNPNKNLIYTLIAVLVILCIIVLLFFPSNEDIISTTYEPLTEDDIKTLKEQKTLNRMMISILVVFFTTIGLIVNNVIFINKHKRINNDWMTHQIQQIAKDNPLVFAKRNTTEHTLDISDFTYNDNKLTATIQLKTPNEYDFTIISKFVGYTEILSSITGSINITADVNRHTMKIDPNDVNTAIMFKIQKTLNDNNIKINPDTVDFNKDKNQVKALGGDSNEIITISFTDDIDDLNINIKSTESEPITLKIE